MAFQINVSLPSDRHLTGTLTLVDDSGFACGPTLACLGKADNEMAIQHGNPTRNPLLPFGDTPLGVYNAICLVQHDANNPKLVHEYGTPPSILLDEVSGDCLTAKRSGRAGIMIHTGALNQDGSMRPTFGCIRLVPEGMEWLIQEVGATLGAGTFIPVIVKEN
jgi:hypothetical protein